jgi:nicotinate-nucleotide adenylyltransferase
MRIALFGGSFDPPHAGHVEPVRAARRELGLDRVLYLPTADPPHKPHRRRVPALARYCMVELALLSHDHLEVSPHELTPGTPAYTADTLDHFRARWPADELTLIVGSDSFAQLDSWVRWRDIAATARLAVLRRPGWDAERLRAEAAPEVLALLDDGRAHLLSDVAPDLSSTHLRAVLARGEEPPADAIAPPVLTYIRKYHLYR